MGSSHRACFFCKFSNTWWAFCPPNFVLPFQQNQPQLFTSHSSLLTQSQPRVAVLHAYFCFFNKPNHNLSLLTYHFSLNPNPVVEKSAKQQKFPVWTILCQCLEHANFFINLFFSLNSVFFTHVVGFCITISTKPTTTYHFSPITSHLIPTPGAFLHFFHFCFLPQPTQNSCFPLFLLTFGKAPPKTCKKLLFDIYCIFVEICTKLNWRKTNGYHPTH